MLQSRTMGFRNPTKIKAFRIVWRSSDSGCKTDPLSHLFVFPAEASRVCALLQDLLEMENEMEEFGMDMPEDETARDELCEGLTHNCASRPHLCGHEEGRGGGGEAHFAEADHLIDIDLTHLNLSPQAAELLALTVIELLAQNVSVFDIEGDSLASKKGEEGDAHRRLASARCRLDHTLIEQIVQKSSFGVHVESKTASFKDAEESSLLTIQPPTAASLPSLTPSAPPSNPRIHLMVSLLCAAVGLDFIGCSAGSSIIGDYAVEALCAMSPREMEEAMGGSYSRVDTEAVDVIHSSILTNVLLLQQQNERVNL